MQLPADLQANMAINSQLATEQATRSLLRQQSRRGFIPPVSENIILDNGVLEGAGTYQGGGQKTNPRNLNILKKKKEEIKKNKKFLTKEKDIMEAVFSSDSEIEQTPQKVVRRPPKRKSAAAPRLIDNPAPQTVTTPRRTRRLNM